MMKINFSYCHSIVDKYHFFDDYEHQKFGFYVGMDYLFDDILSIGMDIGYQGIYSASEEEIKNGVYDDFKSAELFSIPVSLNFGFYLDNIIINTGAGIFPVNSKIKSESLTSKSSFMDFGYSISAGYKLYPDPVLFIVPALRARYLTDSEVLILSIGIDLFFKYKGFRAKE